MGKSRHSKYAPNKFGNKVNHSAQETVNVSDDCVVTPEIIIPEVVEESVVEPEVVEEPAVEVLPVAAVVPPPKQSVIPAPVQRRQPNVLQSLLSVILVNEYKRLERQLLDLKRQLEANGIDSEIVKSDSPSLESDGVVDVETNNQK